jgi:hypothetical protein
VAFTVTRQADSTVKLTVQLSQLFDPTALQQALAGAGIPAVVRTGADCTPQKGELPEAGEVYRVEQVAPTDGPVPPWVFVITPEKMPKNSRLYFSFSTTGEGHAQRGKGTFALVADDDPMNCRAVG